MRLLEHERDLPGAVPAWVTLAFALEVRVICVCRVTRQSHRQRTRHRLNRHSLIQHPIQLPWLDRE